MTETMADDCVWGRGALDTTDGWSATPSPPRYVWPLELDLMAQIAGLALRERWAGWTGEPFTSDSRKHASAREKPSLPGTFAPRVS
jgi:hypothetical protein